MGGGDMKQLGWSVPGSTLWYVEREAAEQEGGVNSPTYHLVGEAYIVLESPFVDCYWLWSVLIVHGKTESEQAIIIKKKDTGASRKTETHQKNDPLKFRLHVETSSVIYGPSFCCDALFSAFLTFALVGGGHFAPPPVVFRG